MTVSFFIVGSFVLVMVLAMALLVGLSVLTTRRVKAMNQTSGTDAFGSSALRS